MLVIPINSTLYNTLKEIATAKRIVFMAGLLGTGKTLMIQQLALLAHEAGRSVHFLQYDIARQAFETQENLSKYPDINGVTDPTIRKALGAWVRPAVQTWQQNHPDPKHILIGELPLIGNRLQELTEPYNDELEPILKNPDTLFTIPIPSWEVREVIEERRQNKFKDDPDKLDSAPNVLRDLWQEVNSVARKIGLTKTKPDTPYNPYIYGGVYEALLQHRTTRTLIIEQIFQPKNELPQNIIQSQLQAAPQEVKDYIKQTEQSYSQEELRQNVTNWHSSITQNPKLPSKGPELNLPLPEALHQATESTPFKLNKEQKDALSQLMNLALDANTQSTTKAIDKALRTLEPSTTKTLANKHKFDVYDSYFNVTRTQSTTPELSFLNASLKAYKNTLNNLESSPSALSNLEAPMLRLALETTLRQFEL